MVDRILYLKKPLNLSKFISHVGLIVLNVDFLQN
jgi:hypothetical protein